LPTSWISPLSDVHPFTTVVAYIYFVLMRLPSPKELFVC
jgi:hypothetical protein